MTFLLIAVLVVAALSLCAAKRSWDEHDDLLLELIALRLEHGQERERWLVIEQQLAAEQRVWRQAGEVHQSVRRAMHDAVLLSESTDLASDAAAGRPNSDERVPGRHQPEPERQPSGLTAEDAQRCIRGRRR